MYHNKHLESKNPDSLCIPFSELVGTNAMSREQKGLQRLIHHTAPHSQYLNCRNHRLALCLVHLIPCYQNLLELDGVLFSLWKMLKYSSIKQAIFEQAQEASNIKPLKVLKACTTRWLSHGESCIRIISWFHPLIDALDVIFLKEMLRQKQSDISFLNQICCRFYFWLKFSISSIYY